jgi:protein TonB
MNEDTTTSSIVERRDTAADRWPGVASAGATTAPAEDGYLEYAAAESVDRRRLRRAVLIAVAAHGALLLVQLPGPSSLVVAAEERPIVHVLETIRPRPPETPPEPRLPRPRTRRVPMPDPTPDAPEPQTVAELVPVAVDEIDPLVFDVPSEAPEPPREEVFQVGGEVTQPVKVHAPAPVYTEIARRARVQGLVLLQAVIDREGNVVSAEIVRGLPMGLDDSALEAVRQWRYEPATLRGRPVAVTFRLSVRFELH